jgi:hypothetical protein
MPRKTQGKPSKKPPSKPLYNPSNPHAGQPTKYRLEYCQDVIDHMAEGGSMEAFGAYLTEKYEDKTLRVHRDTVNEWQHVHREFSDAVKAAKGASARYYDSLGKAGMGGNLRRLATEEPVLVFNPVTSKHEAVIGPDGRPVMKRTYEPASFGQAAYIFHRKNLHGWRDRTELTGEIKHTDPVGSALSKIMGDPKMATAAKLIAEQLVGAGKTEEE